MTAESQRSSPSVRTELRRRIFALTQSVTNPHVQENFRLVPRLSVESPPIEEFVSDQTGGRFVAVMKEGEIAAKHARILENRISVLSGMYTPEGLLILNVPSGTRTVAGHTNSIRRNPETYGTLFREIGVVFGGLERALGKTLEPTGEYPLLRQFATVPDEKADSGGRISLLPPYNLSNQGRTDVLDTVHQELQESGVILPDQATYLVEQVNEGWGK